MRAPASPGLALGPAHPYFAPPRGAVPWARRAERPGTGLRTIVAIVALGLAAACSSGGASGKPPDAEAARATTTIVDDVGRAVPLSVPVRRVAVYNAFNVEFIRGVGAFDAVVGMDEGAAGKSYAGYWAPFDTRNTVGRGQAEPNYEQLIAVRPEVVVFPRNGAWQEAVPKLEPFGIKVVVITGWDLVRHVFNVSLYGVMFDRQADAARLNGFYEKYRDLLATRLKGVEPRRVLLENEPAFSSPLVGSGWHDMIEAGGGTNIFGDIVFGAQKNAKGSVHAFEVDPEAILARNPQLVIKLTGGGYDPASAGDLRAKSNEVMARPGWGALDAVGTGNVKVTGSFPMNACSKIIGALYVAKWLHPDRMADVDPDAVMREWTGTFQRVGLPDPAAYRLTKIG